MKLRAFIACVVCRTTHGILRLIKRGATALPGALALKIYPGILSLAAEGVRIIAVTGTNGKTTSCRMLEKMLSDDGEDVLLNRSGANLRKGIATELILNLSLFGRPKKRTAVIECDEAAARTVLGEIRPAVLLVTNLFKDQMDRYGSVAAPFEAIKAGLIKSPKTLLCANADSPFAAMFAAQTPNECRFFGFRSGTKKSTDSGESGECPRCGARLSYRFVSYANLGDYRCMRCGLKRPAPWLTSDDYIEGEGLSLCACGRSFWIKPALPGLHNAYNAAGAVTAALSAGVSAEAVQSGAESFGCGFGRMEKLALGNAGAEMILVKNAAAVNRTLSLLALDRSPKTVVFIQNARAGDGRDLSWLDDADFESLERRVKAERIILSGEAADALVMRSEKAGLKFETAPAELLPDILSDEERKIYLLPSYTAMLQLRGEIVRRFGGKEFWQ